MRLYDSQGFFLRVLSAGLWEKDVGHLSIEGVDFSEVYKLASEQSVIGLVAAGIERIRKSEVSIKIPQAWVLQLVGETLQFEQRNREMNSFIANLIEGFRIADVSAILVKGQGVAYCYERPLWRACGDVDLLMNDENYDKVKSFLIPQAEEVAIEDVRTKHQAMVINGFDVELHGKMPFSLSKRADREIESVLNDLFYHGNVRPWDCCGTQVFLPSPDNDVVLVFAHFLRHFFIEGVGLRQICDWCRLLWMYRDSLDRGLLERRICGMDLMTEWKTFASLAVDTLGMPVETMPFYDVRFRWKGNRALRRVLKCGNLGHNNDHSYRTNYSGATYKVVAAWRRFVDFASLMPVFPMDAPKFFVWYLMGKVR